MVSFGSVFSGIIAVVLLSVYGYFFITHIRRPVYRDMRFLIFLLFIAGIRMLFPFNLPVNITIPDKGILVPISDVVFYEIPGTGLCVYHILFIVWIAVSLALLILKAIRYHRFIKEAEAFTHRDGELDKLLKQRSLNRHPEKTIALNTDARISPFVYGITRPVIVIPDKEYSEEEIKYVLDHELTHINQHDLLLKWLFNVLTAVFWWNPFIWMIRDQADSAIELSNDISLYQKMSESEKADYAHLIVKTAELSMPRSKYYSLSMATHGDPLIRNRVDDLIGTPPHIFHGYLTLHITAMILIVSVSLIVTPEPYGIHEDQIDGSFSMEEDLGANDENTYIIDAGDHYELYVSGEMIGNMNTIPEEFKEYPVYTEKPDNPEKSEKPNSPDTPASSADPSSADPSYSAASSD